MYAVIDLVKVAHHDLTRTFLGVRTQNSFWFDPNIIFIITLDFIHFINVFT